MDHVTTSHSPPNVNALAAALVRMTLETAKARARCEFFETWTACLTHRLHEQAEQIRLLKRQRDALRAEVRDLRIERVLPAHLDDERRAA